MGNAAYNRGSKAISDQITREMENSNARVAVNHPSSADFPKPEPEPQPTIEICVDLCRDPVPVRVGEKVFCTVTQIRGWMTVTEVKGKGSKLRIKTDCFSGWGYGHNFTRKPADYMTKER